MCTQDSLLDSLSPEQLYERPAPPLPENIYLGTSTWTFPDWKGVVYKKPYASEADFRRNCLREYATIPWFRTVCIDSTFYTPPTSQKLLELATLVPNDFLWISKVWKHITTPHFPKHRRYGSLAGRENPNFLNPTLFKEQILASYTDPKVFEKTGPLILQFPPFSRHTLQYDTFIEKLESFLYEIPKNFRYAVEIRNEELLNQNYFSILNKHGATHCFNQWNSMPSLHQQMRAAASSGGLRASFYVARLLTPRGLSYQEAAKKFEPYTALKQVDEKMRRDAITFLQRAVKTGKSTFITANNKAEGNSALTMASLGALLTSRLRNRS